MITQAIMDRLTRAKDSSIERYKRIIQSEFEANLNLLEDSSLTRAEANINYILTLMKEYSLDCFKYHKKWYMGLAEGANQSVTEEIAGNKMSPLVNEIYWNLRVTYLPILINKYAKTLGHLEQRLLLTRDVLEKNNIESVIKVIEKHFGNFQAEIEVAKQKGYRF
jgi:hypothetical protein